MKNTKCLPAVGAIFSAILLAACGDSSATIGSQTELSGPFASVPRELNTNDTSALTQALEEKAVPSAAVSTPSETFYLAINKNELGKKWFLTAYLTQIFPRVSTAASSLGTRVVSFKVQNGKLFVFDVDDRKQTSDTANPEVIIEAYPIVEGFKPFENMPNSKNFVLFDPAAGMNKFQLATNAFSDSSYQTPFKVDLMFSQRFRNISDGITFDQVFSGSGEDELRNDGSLEPNYYRLSGTIGVALRKYSEGAAYKRVELPAKNHYFPSDYKLIPNESTGEQVAAHWNIKQGMKPIVWTISRDALKLAADPRFAQYDVIGALKAGVENWNAAFGFKALEAKIATPNDSGGDDDTNFIHVDFDNAFGYAFADMRRNPNTGEIRGASVYYSSLWLEIADSIFEDDAPPFAPALPNARLANIPLIARPKAPRLSWGTLDGQELCAIHPHDFLARVSEGTSATNAAAPLLTKKQKVERYLTHVLLHEVGHTLGLRHNFKGSFIGTSSSVMEYIDDYEAYNNDKPGSYDVAAVKYLYGQSTALPTEPFCTDENTRTDPTCNTFDHTNDPLTQDYGAFYTFYNSFFLTGLISTPPNAALNDVLKFVRSGASAAVRASAFKIATDGITVPLDPAKAADPVYSARADTLSRVIYNRLYIDTAASRGTFSADPTDAAITAQVMTQLSGTLLNTDKVRSFASRRAAVDIFKKFQTLAAYQSLVDAKTAITAARPTLTGTDALLTDDLLARINTAISPYFVK